MVQCILRHFGSSTACAPVFGSSRQARLLLAASSVVFRDSQNVNDKTSEELTNLSTDVPNKTTKEARLVSLLRMVDLYLARKMHSAAKNYPGH